MSDRLKCDESTLRDWLINYISTVLDRVDSGVPSDQTFDTYGFDSVELVLMIGVMDEELGIEVDPAMLFEHPSIDALARAYSREGDA
jgi:acyl carrier protein